MRRSLTLLLLSSLAVLPGCAASAQAGPGGGGPPPTAPVAAPPTAAARPLAVTVNGAPRTITWACQQNNEYVTMDDALGWSYSLDGPVNGSVRSVDPADRSVVLTVTEADGRTTAGEPTVLRQDGDRTAYRMLLAERTPALDVTLAVLADLAGLPLCGE